MQTVCFGINDYKGTENDLSVCVADAEAFAKLFGGPVIADKSVTRKSLFATMRSWAASVPEWHGPHDYGFASYSGHGTFLPDDNGDEPDHRDECLVMSDLTTVRDDEFKGLIDTRARLARLVIVTDSCFSGTVYRSIHHAGDALRSRYLPPANLGQHGRPLRANKSGRQAVLPSVVHIAACSDFEFAYEGEANGVLTGALVAAYHPALTIRAWFNAAVKIVKRSGYPQTPQINCSASALDWPVPLFTGSIQRAA